MDQKHDNDSQASVLFMLGQLTAKVDTLLTNQTAHNKRHDALENRVSNLEKDRAKVIGGTLVLSTLTALGLEFLLK